MANIEENFFMAFSIHTNSRHCSILSKHWNAFYHTIDSELKFIFIKASCYPKLSGLNKKDLFLILSMSVTSTNTWYYSVDTLR